MGQLRPSIHHVLGLALAVLLAACGKSPENPVPAAVTASAAATVPAATSTAAVASAAVLASVVAAVAATAPSAATATPAIRAATAVTSPPVASATTAAPGDATTAGPEVAGRAALAEGSVTDTARDGSRRQLKDGDAVYPGDSFVLGPDSYLDLDLEDSGRILLRPNTTFQIVSYHYEPEAHQSGAPTDAQGQPLIKPQQPENSFFKLIKGGLRALDGDIGHTSPQNYGVETPVATIGVRGTAFDVRYCGDDCADEADASGKPENGLYTSVSEGSVGIKNDSGETVTNAGHSGFVRSRRERMQLLSTPPRALRHMDLPDRFKARAEKVRSEIRQRRRQRWQQILERRRAAKAAGKPDAVQPPKALQEQRKQRRQQREQKQTAAPGTGKPATAGQPAAQGEGLTPRQRWQQRRQERQQQREQKEKGQSTQPAATTAPQPADKEDKQGEGRCKGKGKRRRAKGKCGD